MYSHALRILAPAIVLAACSSATEPAASTPTRVAEASNTFIEGSPGAQAITAPTVQVDDQYGNPMPGVTVTFTVVAGGGTLGAAQAVTNLDGLASAGLWTLGPELGANSVVATVVGAGSVTFRAIGIPSGPPTLPTAQNLERGLFRLSVGSLKPEGSDVTAAVLQFRNGSFSIAYAYGSGYSASTEILSGSYQLDGFDIRLYASADGSSPVIATLHDEVLTFKATSYMWPLGGNTEMYTRPPLGLNLSGSWSATAGLAAVDLKSFTLVLNELADGSLEGTWMGTRISCNCPASGYVFQSYSFAESDTVSIALEFGKPGDPTNYAAPYGSIDARPVDATHIVGHMYMSFDGATTGGIDYYGSVALSK
jgi:Bacterial Ig-like domain (group 1)